MHLSSRACAGTKSHHSCKGLDSKRGDLAKASGGRRAEDKDQRQAEPSQKAPMLTSPESVQSIAIQSEEELLTLSFHHELQSR